MKTTTKTTTTTNDDNASSQQESVMKLSILTHERDTKRMQISDIFDQIKLLKDQQSALEEELFQLDEEIERLEKGVAVISSAEQENVIKTEPVSMDQQVLSCDYLATQDAVRASADLQLNGGGGNNHAQRSGHSSLMGVNNRSSKQPTLEIVGCDPSANNDACKKVKMSTLDGFVVSKSKMDGNQPMVVPALSTNPYSRKRSVQHMEDTSNMVTSQSYSWSSDVVSLLKTVFKIQKFRENQEEVINCTMKGEDVFVIMRTGGGKSLTYQLPALLDRPRKVTFVVSPLLSLIEDQVNEMNRFMPNSATSFVSGIGREEHASRWRRVHDHNSGLTLVFVTPEKIASSNKLKSELEKLNERNRLARFVIDEAHCATQWGHDFRPDYTKLGLLKTHFPNIPMIAVTATASNRVRDDCCRILRLNSNYKFFRSTANRPNLYYQVRQKHDNKEKVIENIVAFIKENHPNNAGIVYTFSKKDADNVADSLCKRGIVAASYHSDVSKSRKTQIHRSWMRNDCQVVVATIAFGLGINKPDVRFVIHHTVSKSLEGYYQESGRAGRDGGNADCILYFSPKDVPRMICMIHGDNGEPAFWSMVRYAISIGEDALYRSLLLRCLGEEEIGDVSIFSQSGNQRDVTTHSKTVASLVLHLENCHEDVTLPQLVVKWRAKKSAVQCVLENPPGNDINKEECERIIIHLLLSEILHPKVSWNAYTSTMYIIPGPNARTFLSSVKAKVEIHFPTRKSGRQSNPRAKSQGEEGWLTARSMNAKGKNNDSAPVGSGKEKRRKLGAIPKQGERFLNAVSAKQKSRVASKVFETSEVIELCTSGSETEDLEIGPPLAQNALCERDHEKSSFDSCNEGDIDDDFDS